MLHVITCRSEAVLLNFVFVNVTDSIGALESFGDGIWTATRPMRFWYLETGTRMTVVRLEGGGLFVHSPVALDARMRDAVDALGPVRAIVAPSRFHHMFVPESDG